jgi:hypothetical protein
MTRPYDALGELHLPSRETDDYHDRRTTGCRQLLCACFILLTIAALFKFSDVISSNRTAPFAHASQLTQLADDIDRWERGETRQRTPTVPNSDEFVLVTSVDQ